MRSYWREGPFYDFSMAEIQRLEGAVAQLFEMCVAAGDHIVDNELFDRMRIPPMARPQIRRTWEAEPPSVYGRFDLRYDGEGPPQAAGVQRRHPDRAGRVRRHPVELAPVHRAGHATSGTPCTTSSSPPGSATCSSGSGAPASGRGCTWRGPARRPPARTG